MRATAGSVSGASGPSTPSMAASAVVGGRRSSGRRHVGAGRPASCRDQAGNEPGSRWATTRVVGVDDTGAADLDDGRAGRGDPLGQHLRRRRSADAHDDVGTQLGGQPLVAQHGVEGGDGAGRATAGPTSGRPAPASRWRRRTAPRRRPSPRLPHRPGSRPAPGAGGRRRRSRPPATAGRAALVATGRRVGSGPGSPTSGSRNGRLRCTGPSAAAANARAPERPPRRRGGGVGHAGVVEPAHRPAVQVRLVDRLRRADVAQLRRPVGGQHDHRDLRQPGLDHGRVEVGRRRAARAQQDRRRPAEARARARRTPPTARRGRRARPARARAVRASAIGVLREPGATTAWRTPWATSSSTSVAQNVAWTSAGVTPPTIRILSRLHRVPREFSSGGSRGGPSP